MDDYMCVGYNLNGEKIFEFDNAWVIGLTKKAIAICHPGKRTSRGYEKMVLKIYQLPSFKEIFSECESEHPARNQTFIGYFGEPRNSYFPEETNLNITYELYGGYDTSISPFSLRSKCGNEKWHVVSVQPVWTEWMSAYAVINGTYRISKKTKYILILTILKGKLSYLKKIIIPKEREIYLKRIK